jgi:stage V sporulation protein G
MPQYKSSNGEYKDYCHAVNAEVRGQINNSVIEAYNKDLSLQEEPEPEFMHSS